MERKPKPRSVKVTPSKVGKGHHEEEEEEEEGSDEKRERR